MTGGASFQRETNEALVDRYTRAAAQHGRATEVGDYRAANAAYEVVAEVYGELRRRGRAAQQALLPLLADPDPGVRCWAGAHALEFAASDGERVLVALSRVPGSLVAFGAEVTLQEWRAGRLRFP